MQKNNIISEATMSAIDAINTRRSVRTYASKPVSKEAIHYLLNAAVQAPTAVDEQAWAFAVIEHKEMLKRLSDAAKAMSSDIERSIHVPGRHMSPSFKPPDDFFHGAAALIIICGKDMGPFVVADCWLAAENLMLAGHAMGLGSCVIGSVVSVLNEPVWKKELGIANGMTAIAPIVVGVPYGVTAVVSKKEPQILFWE